ncbi:hypothetical protein [Planktotalea arctica]|uniref:hypothetical protein n=1 Tax=Planktotalea arctica TaxID=1481893 RepID=UPI00111C3B96|nr:hypothetical protein [Planktotalea arctica]
MKHSIFSMRQVWSQPPPALFRAIALFCALGAMGCDNSNMDQEDTIVFDNPTPAQLAVMEANTTLRSGFGVPRADGTFSASLPTIFKGGYEDASGNGVAVEIGRDGTDFSAYGGLLPGSDAGILPTLGIASMSGVYQVAEVGKSQGDTRKYGEVVTTSGRITLRADFQFGTLEGDDGTLIVRGSFSDKNLTGAAFFNQKAAALSGLVGQDRAIGVFHGTDDASAFAGGFLVDR